VHARTFDWKKIRKWSIRIVQADGIELKKLVIEIQREDSATASE
jgi:hypothetical protein